jgi:hypothetical protein
MRGAGNMTGKNLLSSLCRGILVSLLAIFCGFGSLDAMTSRDTRSVKDLLKFMATHRAVTLGLRINELNTLVEKTKGIHPVELSCFILGDEERIEWFKKINKNFFKQMYLLNEWHEIFVSSFRILDFEEVEEMIETANLDKEWIKDLMETNNFTELLTVLFEKGKS